MRKVREFLEMDDSDVKQVVVDITHYDLEPRDALVKHIQRCGFSANEKPKILMPNDRVIQI